MDLSPRRNLANVRAFMFAAVVLPMLFPTTGVAAIAWPGESWSASVDLTPLDPTGWASNLSGAYWNPETRRLWVCTNGPAKFWSLREDGLGGFLLEREYTGSGDLEGITQISTAADLVFVVDEQGRTIRAYRVSDGAAVTSWFLSTIPDWGNSGPEGLAFVPDAWLAQNNFADGSGNPYSQSIHGGNGFGGIVFVAVQTSGWVYAVDLRTDGTYTSVGRYLTSRAESCEMTFDASIGKMYILHNIDGNLIEITDLTSTAVGTDRRFNTYVEVQVPSGSNIEGFALTPALTATKAIGDNGCFFTDDSNVDGALRWFTQLHSRLEKRDGDGQTAGAGSAVAIPPSVAVSDPFTNPLPGFAITFAVASGGGSITGGNATTDSGGVASVGSWVLGGNPGLNTLTASGADLTGSPQAFSATGVDLTALTATIEQELGNNPTGADSVHFKVTFSAPVAPTFSPEDITLDGTLAGAAALELADTDPVFSITVILDDPNADGTIGIAIAPDSVWTIAGNRFPGGSSQTIDIFNWRGFLSSPEGAQLYAGDSHQLQVEPNCGSPILSYQWKWDDGQGKMVHDAGSDTPALLLSNIHEDEAGEYWCEVSYDGETHPSARAAIAVEHHVQITQPPQGGTRTVGDSHTFTVVAAGGYAPLSYAWHKDGSTISGATLASYARANLTEDDTGTYSVDVNDAYTDFRTASTNLTVTQGLPATGLLNLVSLAGFLIIFAIRTVRNTRPSRPSNQR